MYVYLLARSRHWDDWLYPKREVTPIAWCGLQPLVLELDDRALIELQQPLE